MTALHQFLPTFAGGDAIGMHCVRLQQILRDAGFDSEIYAGDRHDDVRHAARDVREFRAPGASETWALYHFSVGNPMAEYIERLDVPVGLDYHNITEARYFERWEPTVAGILHDGRRQLASMAPKARFAIAHSRYSETELIDLGIAPTTVAPILVDFSEYDGAPDRALLDRRTRARANGGADWLFVGRLAPNKCQQDVIAAFAAYRAVYDHAARLTLVGGKSAIRYSDELKRMCRELGLADAVTFTDVVSHDELLACYRTADVFVCLSEHEGFAVPVLEAMRFDVPVVAYAAAAVPETVGDGGLLLEQKDPLYVAAAVSEVLGDTTARKRLTVAGRERVEQLGLEHTGPLLLAALEKMMVGA